MEDRYVTLTGLDHYYGKKPFCIGGLVLLVPEPENEHDAEAVRAVFPRLGTVGYVANSPSTVARGTCSAGRIVDRIGGSCFARVMFITRGEVLARLEPGVLVDADVLCAQPDVVFQRG